ncbi:MAG: PfkB family carbohydrate kinase [Candidatus Bathyarchaeota archaeon]|nr:PfkB family carbohydrate kinase [Candidatus Bathyarchaeota archaeon]MDH5494469.1 PfkB family carbohydrate kinase [Candidatus Bathyarchaeota archaeon]
MFDLVTVGHFVIDLIISPRIPCPKTTLGGPAAFVSLAANKLGANVSVVSKVGKDFQKHLAWLHQKNVDLSQVKIVENAFTTAFLLTYDNGKRKLQLKNRAPQIFSKDISTSLRARAIHAAPVANELSVEVIRKLRSRTPLLSVDPQGFLREFDETGGVRLKKLSDMSFLQNCDAFKSTIQEIKLMTGHAKIRTAMKRIHKCGVKIVLVTMGKKGILAHFGEKFYHIPACKPKILKDPTGAGDVFIGAFLAEYIRSREPLWCCCVGSAAASFIIEDVGSRRFGEKSEVYERATKIYEKGIKPLPDDTVV